MSFNESLFTLKTPWRACVALEEYLSHGGEFEDGSGTNWAGILSFCHQNMIKDAANSPDDLSPPSLHEALAWAYLEITISDSLVKADSRDAQSPLLSSTRSMWTRATMIVRCGHFPGDWVCDLTRVLNWCFTSAEVQLLLRAKDSVPIQQISSEVRLRAEILEMLVIGKRLEFDGDVAKLISMVKSAVQNGWDAHL